MKMVKSAFLASAAGLVAMSGAQAADLPVKAKPVEYVKVCSLYGAGFYYIPGTDICMKIGGYVRYQQSFGTTDITGGALAGTGALGTREASMDYPYRSRAIATFDTRQQTAYGTLRTYLLLGVSSDSGTDGGTIVSNIKGANTTRLYATRAFIQIAGFTFGKATSFFDFFASAAVAYNAGAVSSPDTGDGGQIVAAYTAQFGNGMSASIAAEAERQRGTFWANGAATAATADNLGGSNRLQDIVGNIRVDQAWGSAQISAALHEVSGSYYGAGPAAGVVEWNGHPDAEWGWAFSGGLRLNAPMIGPGDYFQIQAVYAEGATQYASNTPASFLVKQGQVFGVGTADDAVFTGTAAAPGLFDLTTAWSVAASFEHFWTPSLRTSIYGSYFDVSRSDGANNALCNTTTYAAFGAATSRAGGCDLDYTYWVVGSRSQWNITKDLYVGVDVMYQKLETATMNAAGTYTAAGGNGVVAGAFYNTGDVDAVSATWRIHRDIVP